MLAVSAGGARACGRSRVPAAAGRGGKRPKRPRRRRRIGGPQAALPRPATNRCETHRCCTGGRARLCGRAGSMGGGPAYYVHRRGQRRGVRQCQRRCCSAQRPAWGTSVGPVVRQAALRDGQAVRLAVAAVGGVAAVGRRRLVACGQETPHKRPQFCSRPVRSRGPRQPPQPLRNASGHGYCMTAPRAGRRHGGDQAAVLALRERSALQQGCCWPRVGPKSARRQPSNWASNAYTAPVRQQARCMPAAGLRGKQRTASYHTNRRCSSASDTCYQTHPWRSRWSWAVS